MTGSADGPTITSTANPRVKAWLRLRDRRARERAGRTLVDGTREIGRALAAGAVIEEVIASSSALESAADLVAALEAAGVPIVPVAESVAGRVAFGGRTDGLVAVVRVAELELGQLGLPADPLVVVLEAIEKPGNLGAIVRSADGAGADAVIVADPRTDLFNPNSIRASLGSVFAMPLGAASSEAVAAWCRSQRLRLIAARVDASLSYTEADMTGPLALVFGAEASGLGVIWSAPDVLAVRLPMHGVADSLNVAAAAAVLLYEARRQRGRRRES
jgi:TrmH family RNA methyltransferase